MRLPITASCFATAVLLSACAQEPSITASDVWHEAYDETVVSVCYSASAATREQVVALAASRCPAVKPAVRLIDEDSFLNDCPLSKRKRATFMCVAQ